MEIHSDLIKLKQKGNRLTERERERRQYIPQCELFQPN